MSGFITNSHAATITAAEYFIDTDPGEGMGTPIPTPIDGAYDSAIEQVQFPINTSTLKLGHHTVYVRMKNSDGAWGIARPMANDMEFATPYNLNVEGNKIITGAEYFFDTDPGPGNGTPVTAPADGAFDSGVENLEITSLNTSGLSPGLHTVFLRSKDNNGDWGVVREYTFEVRSPNVISGGKFAVDYDPVLEESTLVDDFSTGETWTENQGTGSANNGVYNFALTGMTDPYFWKNITDFEESLKYLVITYRSYTNGPSSMQLFYTDGVDCTAWNAICSQLFPIINDGAWHTVTFEVTDPEWTDNDGIITQLRFDLEGASALGTFSVDDIRFANQRLSQAITPVDGAFDETIESGTGSINTGELPGGGHTIYLRMRDATGWGPLVTNSLGVSAPMVQFTSQPEQTVSSGGKVPFDVLVEDHAGSDTYRMKVEYSTDNVTWNKATLSGSLVDNGQDFQVGPIATSGGVVNLTLTWKSGTDLSNQEHNSVALRLMLDNFAGRNAQTISSGFVLDNKSPIVPALLSPADNIGTNDPTPLFIWQGVEEGAVYRLQVDNHSDFSSPIIDQSSLSGNVYAVLTPAPPAQYFWRVKATDVMGNQSAFSPASDFKILSDTTPPSVALSYSNNPAAAGTLLITATFSEPIDTMPTITVDQPGTVDEGPVSMTGSGNVWTYAYEVHKAIAPDYIDGAAKVTIANAKDAAGNPNQPATNDTFVINTSQPAGTIVAAEYFIDTDPSEGMGTPIPTPIDGAYDSAKEEVQFTIDTSTLKLGRHTVYVRMKNSDGAWGIARPIANDMEFAAPYNLNVEGNKIITAAEYFFDTDPGLGNGIPITAPADGAFDDKIEAFELSGINTSGLTTGLHTVYIRSKDNNGDWGVVREYTFEVRNHNVISGGKFAVDYDPILEESTLVDDFSAGEAWAENQGTGSANNGVYNFALTSLTDPYFWKNITDFEESLKYLVITYRNYTNGPGAIQLFYTDGVDCTAWNAICAQSFPIINDGAWHTVTFEVTDPEWTDNDGVITQLRFDLEGAASLGTFSVDDIRFANQRLSQAITPVDGAFDETIESGTGSISTGELPGGGHTIYLRMRDATGWGPLVTNSLGVSAPMVQFTSQPEQTVSSGGQVPFNVRVEDHAGSDTYRMKVEYSTDNVTWKKATLSGSLVDNSQDFQVGPIATSGGVVNLALTWRSGTDLSNEEHNSVALRLMLDNFAGRSAQTISSSFVLDNKAPIVPALISPADNIETRDPTPLFIWQGVEEGAVYRLQVDNHADFSSPIIDQSSLSGNAYAVLTPAPPAQYFWRVKATDGMGNQNAFSPASDFKILSDTTPPSVALSYSNNPAAAGTLLITAAFSEPIDTVPTIKVDQPGTVDEGPVSMTGSGDVWTYAYEVHKASPPDYIDGAAKVTIANAKDAAGNPNQPATNDTFVINTSQPAGTIVAAEYFIDTDPGEGLGTPITTPVDGAYDSAIEQVQFTIDTSALKLGRHTVYVRMKNSDGAWGIARPIANDMEFAVPYNLDIEGNKIITAAEYFFDTDPGQGNGIPITAPADGRFDSGVENFKSDSFNLNDLSKGLHTLYLRAKDTNGDWGPAREYTFEVRGPSGGIITASEYYIDVDPGPGNGTLLKVNDGAFDEVTEQVHAYLNTTGVSEGPHEVCVRAYSSGGEWSSQYCENLTVGITTTCLPLSGVLRDEITRKPLADITVNIDGGAYSTKTDQNGFYNFACISNGKHVVTVVVPTGYVSYSRTIDIPLNSIWDIKLTRSETVNGTDTDSGYSKDPVNTATGNYTYQRMDIEIPGIGIPFTFERAYNSLNPFDGPLGFGWTHNYIITLTLNDDGAATIRWGDGRTETWTPEIGGGFKSQYGVFDNLIDNKNGTYTLRKKDLTRYNFDTSGRLSSIVDKNGNKINLTYTTKGLTHITDTAGRVITINYDSKDHITLITDPIGRTITFAYNSKGDLISASDMNGNPTQYTYDLNHQMLSAVDPRGNTIVANVYDNQKRVVVSQKDAKQGETKYTYVEVDKKTIILDALGNKTTHYHDELLRLIQEEDAKGNSAYYAYNEAGSRIRIRDRNGNITKYTYDGRGNVTSKTDALNIVTTITYDANNNPLTRTEAVGISLQRTTTFEYDAKGNLLKTTNASGGITEFTYDTYGQPLTIKDPRGNTTFNKYDAQGNLIEVADALGNKTTYTYDGVGRRLTATDALLRATTYIYDDNNNLLEISELAVFEPLHRVTGYTYDKNNNRLTVTDPKGKITQYVYDVKDLLTTITDPLSNSIIYTYDALDRKTSITDKNGNITGFAYDATGNLIEVSDQLGKKTAYSYDPNGNRLTETDPLLHTTTYKYDAMNRLIEIKDPLGNATTTVYDELGRVKSVTNAIGQTTAFEYDLLDRLNKVTDFNNGIVAYTYDPNGNRLTMTDPNGNTTTYEYDALNRLVLKTEPLGGVSQYVYDVVGNMTSMTDPNADIKTYTYDELNRLIMITYPDTSSDIFSYDANNNRISMTDNLGNSVYTYDDLNRMTTYTDPFGKVVGYGYDNNGNRTSLTYPDGKVVNYVYDGLNRVETVTDWLGKTTTYAYDDTDKLTGILNPNNTSVAISYDNSDRMTELSNIKSDSTIISSYTYTLDGIGNHNNVTQNEPMIPIIPSQNVAYTYDAENRMTDAGGVVNSFDLNGNMTAKGSDIFSYDYNNRLMGSTITGVVTQYGYDGLGNRMVKNENGLLTRYVLDINGSLSNVVAETDGNGNITAYYVHGLGLISKVMPNGTAHYYHYDSRGSTIALTNADENITDAYAYDPFGKVVNSFGVTSNPFRYVGRYGVQDERNGLAYIRARYYIPEHGRFITKDPLTGKDGDSQSLNRYVYALNNPVRLMDISGLSPKEGETSKNLYSSTEMTLDFLKIITQIEKVGWSDILKMEFLDAIRRGGYSKLDAKLLKNLKIAGDIATVASLYLNINQEIESATGSNIIKYWYETFSIGIQEDIKGLNTDDYLDSLALGLSSATAVSWNTATGLFNSVIKLSTKNKLDIELSGADIYQGTKYAVDNKLLPHLSGITDMLGNIFYQIGWY